MKKKQTKKDVDVEAVKIHVILAGPPLEWKEQAQLDLGEMKEITWEIAGEGIATNVSENQLIIIVGDKDAYDLVLKLIRGMAYIAINDKTRKQLGILPPQDPSHYAD